MGWCSQVLNKRHKTLTYPCAFCWAKLEAPKELAGQMQNCPSCGKQTLVPTKQIYRIAEVFVECYEQMYQCLQKIFKGSATPLRQTGKLELGTYMLFRLFARASTLQKPDVGRCIFALCVHCIVPMESERIYKIVQHRLDLYKAIAQEKKDEDSIKLVKACQFELVNFLLQSKDDYSEVNTGSLGTTPLAITDAFLKLALNSALLRTMDIFDSAILNVFSGNDDITLLTIQEIDSRIAVAVT